MAIDTSRFQNFSYIRDNGLNKYLVEEYLLPGLAAQSRLGKGSRGIPLPTPFGKPQEFIALEDAANLILTWLEENNHLYTKDKGQLIKLMRKVSYEQFATIAAKIYQDRVEDPNKLFTTARQQNLTIYREAQKKQGLTTSKYDPGKAIDDYNSLYTQLLRAANLGASPALFQKILPHGVPTGDRDLSKHVLAQIIIQNITELRGAAHAYAGDEDKATVAVSRKLGAIISTSYPEQAAYLNLLGDKEISTSLNQFTQNVERQLDLDGIKLEEVDSAKNRAIASAGDIVATEYEIYQQIQKVVPFTSDSQKKEFAKALIRSINSSAGRPQSLNEILSRAGALIKDFDTSQLEFIQNELHKSGLDFAIEYRQNELSIILDSHRLTMGERNLLRRGINPFKTEKSEADLTIEKDRLLKEYEENTGLKFATIAEAAKHEQFLNPPIDSKDVSEYWGGIHASWTRRFREHEDQMGAYTILDFNEKSIINRTRFGRWVENTRSRMYELQTKFFDKWVDFDENLPWNKGIKAAYEWYDKLAENFTVKVGKAQIPLFRIVPWIYDRIDEWKKVTTVKALAKTSTWKSTFGKFIHWNIKQYQLGDHTVNGALFETFRSAWGSGTKWVLTKSAALATKLGADSAFKYASVSASRTATRLLLQIGGRTLARLGAEAGAALIGLAGGVTAAFSVVIGALMVIDLLKLGWHLVSEFFRNGKFREKILGLGATVGAYFAAINLGTIGVLATALFAGLLQTLLLALVIVGIMVASITFMYHSFDTTIRLDSNVGQLITSVLCKQDGEGGNSAVNTAACIVEILAGCNLNPLTSANSNSSRWQCALASFVAADAMNVLKASANAHEVLQCVGLIAAVDAATGGSGHFTNAKDLDVIRPSGYNFVSGVGSCSPGDFFVDKNGDWGHTGIFIRNDGPYIKCIDANAAGPGIVRGADTCVWDTNKIAGCLKKI